MEFHATWPRRSFNPQSGPGRRGAAREVVAQAMGCALAGLAVPPKEQLEADKRWYFPATRAALPGRSDWMNWLFVPALVSDFEKRTA